ncbi:LOW QUALITY PROTEIN: alpha-protein kinase 2 [Onychostruthus taczanowskii]|uniref:LOW QUALITY PROTEIN: alpha-protein kinase 2 n=1 Tax=Onychostruthus taczanowskii TaxID=356909 RepID=UPI001B80466F|nr:LOW QUALITY PROTEIN: alpha-protein kinase 2 [Onychostruthus taczanowskii]
MDAKNVVKSQATFSCLKDLLEDGDDLLHLNGVVDVTAGRAEEYCSRQVPSHSTDVTTCHTGSCCLNTKDSGSPQSLADVQACKRPGLGRPLSRNSLLGEQADTSLGNLTDFGKDDSENSAAVLEIYAEKVTNVSDDFSDDDLEYFECSDVLTVHEDEIWKKKLEFLLESDDEDDLKLGKDCDGCAYFLSEMPCVFQVSDNTTPMDTPIGFCEHQSKTKGVNVRRDPSMYSQSALQTEMTLTVGHHRDKSAILKDKEKNQVPVSSAATGNEHPRSEEETNGSGHLAAGSSRDEPKPMDTVPAQVDSSANGIGAACTDQASGTMTETSPDGDVLGESSLLLEEGRGNVPEGNARHAVCTLTESLRRNLLKLLNPIELCRYVSTIGQSFQAAAAGRESRAPSPSQEGICSAQIPEEAESVQMQAGLCLTEEADRDSHWERKRTWGLSEQKQMPDENILFGSQSANLKSVTQNCENLCMEPRTEKEGIFRTCESAGTSQLSAENRLQVKNADLQTSSLHCAPCEKREGCHQQVFSGQQIIRSGKKSENNISPSPRWDMDSLPDKQERLCAVLSSAKLCDEPGEGEQRPGLDTHDSSNPDILCSRSADEAVSEANPKSVLESGEPECQGDADISAVHDKLWKLLHEDDSDYRIPPENRGVPSLGTRLTDIEVTELNFVGGTCSDQPLPMDLIEEQEPITEPAHNPRTEKAACNVSDILLQRAAACESASIGNICLAQVVGTDGVCLNSGTGNERETPSICVSASSVLLRTQECLEPNPMATDRNGSTVAWEGKLAVNNAAQTCEADSPQRLQNTQSCNLACAKADISDMSRGTAGQLLHTECNIAMTNESVPGEGCHFMDSCPVRGELPYFLEEEDIFPSEKTSQFIHAEHSSVNTIHKSCVVNLQEKGNHSGLSAPNFTNSDSYHLSKNNGCQDFQVVSNAQKYSDVMQSPSLIQIQENIRTHKNLPQNTDQLTETAKQEGAVPPPSGEPFLRDFYVEVPSCEPCKPGGEQREICIPEEHRAEASCDSGVSQVSESQTAASLCNTAEQHSFFVDSTFRSDEGLKIDSSKNPTYAAGSVTSVSAPLPREAQSEHHSTASGEDGGSQDWLHSPQLLGNKTLPFPTSVSHSEGLPSESAVACPVTRNEGKTGSIKTGVKVNGNLTTLEISCKSWKGLSQRVPGETKGEAALCENEHEIPRAIEYNPDEAEAKAPLHTLTGSQALEQIVNTEQSCPDLIPSSKIAEAENSIKSTEYDKKEEVRTAESVVSGLVNLPSADSGNNQCFQEQPPHRRTSSFSLVWTTLDPFPVNTESQRNQEGSKSCQIPVAAAEPEPIRCREDTTKSGHVAAGAKKKLPPATLSKKPRLEERGSVSKDTSCVKKSGKSEGGVIHKEDRKEQRKLILKKDSKAPRLLKKIQAELFPDCSGSIKLCCQFGDIHGDSTITWTKDSKVLAQLQRSAQDVSPVSLEIAEASYQDQGMYYCCLNNMYGKVTAEFHLTAAVLERLSSFQSYEGVEEIEFMQLMFREDPLSSSYFGGTLHGAIMTEGLHFGEGMHRRAFRSRVLQGLAPAFAPGHPCVLKVHSALAYGTKSRDELLQKNYSLALQECYVQNTAREYAKLYAAEAEPLEGFGEVPEIIQIFLIHRPANNIPYATVEEELVGEFVKYSVKDGKEVNFLRRDSEAGQKCCTFQHWVYEKTNGNLLVTDLQGVGMKLTDVGIATLAKGYKGFKGNCSFSFIEQFRALHQCNGYCEMLGLKSLRTTHQKRGKQHPLKAKICQTHQQ